MSYYEEGGTAFPICTDASYHPGMTLRDYFAGQVVVGAMSKYWNADSNIDVVSAVDMAEGWNRIAEHAYGIADAMLEARK